MLYTRYTEGRSESALGCAPPFSVASAEFISVETEQFRRRIGDTRRERQKEVHRRIGRDESLHRPKAG